MISGFYAALSGARASRTSMDISAGNIANLNTTGYKAQKGNFSELMNGAAVRDTSVAFTQGAIEMTGDDLQAAISGDGFFAVRDAAGNISFTRAGDFTLSDDGTGPMLVTRDGDFVLDRDMQPVKIEMTAEGNVIRPGIFSFARPDELDSVGGGRFAPNDRTGPATASEGAKLVQGALEASTADMTDEMTAIMAAQRAFQLNVKMLQTADELEQTANSMRG